MEFYFLHPYDIDLSHTDGFVFYTFQSISYWNLKHLAV